MLDNLKNFNPPIPSLLECCSKEDVARWAKNLIHIRLCIGARAGHANEGDSYRVKFKFSNEDELNWILNSLNIDNSTPKKIHNYEKRTTITLSIYDLGDKKVKKDIPEWAMAKTPPAWMDNKIPADAWAKISAFANDERNCYAPIELTITQDNFLSLELMVIDSYVASEADFSNAKFIDDLLEEVKDYIVEPPMENNRCISPVYYPELWSDC